MVRNRARGKRCRHPKQMFTYIGNKKVCRICNIGEISVDTDYTKYSDLMGDKDWENKQEN